MMRSAVPLIALFLFLVIVPPTLMQDNTGAEVDASLIAIPDTQSIALNSAINGRDYQLSIALPASYNTSEQSYPVLYLLDPFVSFLSVTELVRFLAPNQLPELIVVGIGYPTGDIGEVFALREQDYHRSQDEFLEFISEELMPLVDSTYRTDTTDRALVGFSYGGELVLHSLLLRPELFNRYVAIDSSISEFATIFSGDDTAFRERIAGLNLKLFFAASGTELLSGAVQAQDYDGLEATGLSLGNVTHEAALHLSLPAGIMAVYAE